MNEPKVKLRALNKKEAILLDFVKWVAQFVALEDGKLTPTQLAKTAQLTLERYKNESD